MVECGNARPGPETRSICLAGGIGSCDLISGSSGGKTLTAAYGGDANYEPVQDTEPHTVTEVVIELIFSDSFESSID